MRTYLYTDGLSDPNKRAPAIFILLAIFFLRGVSSLAISYYLRTVIVKVCFSQAELAARIALHNLQTVVYYGFLPQFCAIRH